MFLHSLGQPISVERYFDHHASLIFREANITSTFHNQSGGVKRNYAKSFGTRTHVGFTFGPENTRASHFFK